MGLRFGVALGLVATMGGLTVAQKPAEPPPTAPIERRDAALDVASAYIGRALFLRCFCAENNFSFDDQGRPLGAVKAEDWTLAAVNVLKVERKKPGEIEMEGVRVAIKFVPERREFERHPQNDDKMRITVADTGDPKRMQLALKAVFAVGIDLPLQRSMPEYWRHYFDPQAPWPPDDLGGQVIYVARPSGSTGGPPVYTTAPNLTHRAEASYTPMADRDRVKGSVRLRFIVDALGAVRRVAIVQPLGYGLDERAVEAIAKFRFAPAEHDGKPVAALVAIEQEFDVVPVPR